MVAVQKIDSSLFPKLYEAFLVDDDPLSDEQTWRNVFDYQFPHEEGYSGYAMLDGDDVVGMLGMVFSRRRIDGDTRNFCNLHTWWVREDYRGYSLSLLRPILGLDGYTITYFTPCDTIRAVTKRLGFKQLSTQVKILLPLASMRAGDADSSEVIYDHDSIEQSLEPDDKRIFRDHQPYGLGHLLLRSKTRTCYVLYTHVVRHRLPYCHIHYVSDIGLFSKLERVVRSSLLSKYKARFIALDTRLVSDTEFPFSFDFWAPAHGMCKSSEVSVDRIDNLYSDVVFLKLTTLPNMSHELWNIAHRYLRFIPDNRAHV